MPSEPTEGTNVILLVLDTLRPDFLSCYDGEVETPAIDSIAERGVLFEEAYAAGPGSSISHAALFSGQYPSNSGVVGRVDVPEDSPLLAKHLSDAGYDTFGLPGVGRTSSEWGYDRGFDRYLEKWHDIPSSLSLRDVRLAMRDPELVYPMPREVVRSAVYGGDKHTSYLIDVFSRKLKRLTQPFFAFGNIPTVHAPYNPPRPFKEDATPELVRRRWGLTERLFGKKEYLNREDVRLDRIQAVQKREGTARYFGDPTWLSDTEMEILRQWYAASVKYLDSQLQKLFDELESSGLLENTVLIITADHGEHFGEHNLLKHMYFLFEECLHVPLIMVGPELPKGIRRKDLVSLIDVFDTICDLLGIDPPEATDGRTVFGGEHRSAVYSENGIRRLGEPEYEHMSEEKIDQFERGRKGIRTEDYLYTFDSEGDSQLYERPEETVVQDGQPVIKRLHEQLLSKLGNEFKIGYQQDNVSPNVEANLRELGYIQ